MVIRKTELNLALKYPYNDIINDP
ncbi:hypothetical protein FPC831_1360001 [Flavobacterium psychrophilum]|nr:hypothetical protein FI146_270023 [Flavobacterium psychrophilum]SNB00823.1 hypothetical protein FPC831_1360001 [Flavobacterium psychrophilum]SNB23364.1 hypothetical protein JIP1600_860010 [Flavobacterium psychrophilum]SNB95485.1 hypothetical protein FPC840_1420010 [Flavobacterium psychrophilum]